MYPGPTRCDMRKYQFVAIAAFGFVTLAGAPLAHAQDVTKANVPFPFVVGQTELPAGHYRVVSDAMTPGFVDVLSEDGRSSAFAMVLAAGDSTREGECRFEFEHVGGKYYLSRIDTGTGEVKELEIPSAVLAAERLHAANAKAASLKG